MRGELLRADHGERLRCRSGVHRHDVGIGQERVERIVGGVVAVGVEGDHAHPQAFEPPPRRATDRAEPDQAGGSTGDLPRAVALVGQRAVAEHLQLADVAVGRQQMAGDGEQQRNGDLCHAIGVAARRVEHGDAACRRRRDVDVRRVASR